MIKKQKEVILNTIIVVFILSAAFLSQSAYFRPTGEKVFSQGVKEGNTYWLKISDWVKTNIYPKVSGEVVKRGEVLQQEIEKQKNNAAQTIFEKIKNYLAEKFSKTFGTEVK